MELLGIDPYVELGRSKLPEIALQRQMFPHINTDVTLRKVPLVVLPVSVIFGKREKALKIVARDPVQYREVISWQTLFQKLVEMANIPQRDAAAVAGNVVAIVVKMVMPAP